MNISVFVLEVDCKRFLALVGVLSRPSQELIEVGRSEFGKVCGVYVAERSVLVTMLVDDDCSYRNLYAFNGVENKQVVGQFDSIRRRFIAVGCCLLPIFVL